MGRFDTEHAAALISAARRDAGLTQESLARRAGVSQPNLATMESGSRRPSSEMLDRILAAADYRPSLAVELHAPQIIDAARRLGLAHPLLFGSLVRGEDHHDSDIDLFVSAPEGAGLFPLAALSVEVERLTGFPADIVAVESAARTKLGTELIAAAVAL